MKVNLRTIGAAKAKSTLLALLDDVEDKREPIVITRNGKPVARMMPMPFQDVDPIFGFYRGNLDILGDVVSPLYSDEELDAFEMRTLMQLKGTEPAED